MSGRNKTIFISYRREDSQAWAGRIADHLDASTDMTVLIDVDSIERGVDYRKAIAKQIEDSDVVLVVIGRNWLDVINEAGSPRLKDADDPVLLEIEAALSNDKRVVPVTVDGARLPTRPMLPAAIGDLAVRNGLSLTHESFRSDLERLIDELSGRARGRDDRDREETTPVASHGSSTASLRVKATLVDVIPTIVSLALIAISPAIHPAVGGISLLLGMTVQLVFILLCCRVGSHSGQTFGKQALGIRAVALEGGVTASPLRHLARETLKYLWCPLLGAWNLYIIPVLMLMQASAGRDGLMWHDKATKTRVVSASSPEISAGSGGRDSN